MKLKIKFVKTKNLTKDILSEIINIKNQEWKYKKSEHRKWFKKNMYENDYHSILYYKKRLIGYTALRDRKMIVNNSEIRSQFFFDTHIIEKNFRNFFINNYSVSKFFMEKINLFLKKKKKLSFLLCNNKMKKYYILHKWSIIKKTKVKIIDKKSKLNLMCYGKINKKNNYLLFTN